MVVPKSRPTLREVRGDRNRAKVVPKAAVTSWIILLTACRMVFVVEKRARPPHTSPFGRRGGRG
jgi:hypothetical protein